MQDWEREQKTLFVRSTPGDKGAFNSVGDRLCVLTEDVLYIKSQYKVALVECSLQEAKKIHLEGKLGADVNYLFFTPPSAEEMTVRLLRSRPGQDSQLSLNLKVN